MTNQTKRLLFACIIAIAGLILLQFFWTRNYYQVTRFNFEREVNLAFEDAIKKDFQLRCDTIEQLLTEQLMDTSQFSITSSFAESTGKEQFRIYNARDKKDFTSFSHLGLDDPLQTGDSIYKRKIAGYFAHALRSEDLENHVVYYRTQNLGHFINDKIKEYGFDTARLRPVLRHYLAERNINTPFYFLTRKMDSSLNHIHVPDSIAGKGQVLTKSYSTYKWWNYDENYVRAVFNNPQAYILSQLKWMLLASLLLVSAVGLCIALLIKALFKEKKLTRIKNDFINNISHELKTPVATVSAAVQVLQEMNLGSEQVKADRYLGHAQTELTRLNAMFDSILNTALHENQQMVVQAESINLRSAICGIIETLKISSDKKIDFCYENNSGVSDIMADPLLFQQAIRNILDNAIKYSGEEVQISMACKTEYSSVQISCTDNGGGISPSSLPFIFEKFYREPKPNHAVKGYGLGLNNVRQIMKAHGGEVKIISSTDKGTTVILSWPI